MNHYNPFNLEKVQHCLLHSLCFHKIKGKEQKFLLKKYSLLKNKRKEPTKEEPQCHQEEEAKTNFV
jgi:hypothetical protein